MDVVRAYQEPDRWWLEYTIETPPPPCHQGVPFKTIDAMPEPIAEKLSVLLHLPVGGALNNVGHRVARNCYMVYVNNSVDDLVST